VDGLQEEFGSDVLFLSLNAADSASGESLFQHFALRGHPNIVILDADTQEIFRTFGQIEEDALRMMLKDIEK